MCKKGAMSQHTSIELSRQAFQYNIDQLKKAAGAAGLALVVKSNAYGHGLREMALLADENPSISWICTAGLSEALFLRRLGINKQLLVLSFIDDGIEEAVALGIHVMCSNREDACAMSAAAERLGKKAYIHVKVDTGMSRLGIFPDDVLGFLKFLSHLPQVIIAGIATHLSDTPNPDQTFSYQQFKTFDTVVDIVKAAGFDIPYTHVQSSSSLCLRPEREYSFIRAGAAAYGIWKSAAHRELIRMHHPYFDVMPVLHLKTRIVHIKKIPAGSAVGYDRTFIAQRPTVLAIAPVGYFDGYSRGLSNRGHGLIHNQFVPIAGIVSMNLTAFDVTDLEVSLHDEISLIGPFPGITASECAQSARIITNEMVTHLNPTIVRRIVPAHHFAWQDTSPTVRKPVVVGDY